MVLNFISRSSSLMLCVYMFFQKIYMFSFIIYLHKNVLLLYPVQQDLLDPPEDCFRIRLIIALLQTCGHYFSRGSSKRKLDRFLLLFQIYALRKGQLPLDVEFDVQVCPNSKRQELVKAANPTIQGMISRVQALQ